MMMTAAAPCDVDNDNLRRVHAWGKVEFTVEFRSLLPF